MRYLLLVLLLCSCHSQTPLSENNLSFVKVESRQPSGSCRSLGHVNGVSLDVSQGTVKKYENSLKDIKRSVSSLGGNFLHIQKVVNDGAFIAGEAFQCD